ncbi:hypothetical protein JOC37_000851 [Desulfohalotomaculum tongense]|uniref:hypothetical protein n=1 Tax=Desulforadius tongensis TaxID=1216062 RepID=UPI001959B7E0|nr:hypothetical protein [Desulforadius tongensis]MBM7854478.1 hypothetical protein [Desulforadius tongensis]
MSSVYKSSEDVTETVNLLTSILVRYPEISTINFNPEKKTLKLNFIFADVLEESELKSLQEFIRDSIEAYNMLERKKANILKISSQIIESLTIIQIERDIDTLVQGEIALIIQSLHQAGKTNIITENPETFYEDDLKFQEEMIEAMLENVKSCNKGKPLFAFRADGRVLVFNK